MHCFNQLVTNPWSSHIRMFVTELFSRIPHCSFPFEFFRMTVQYIWPSSTSMTICWCKGSYLFRFSGSHWIRDPITASSATLMVYDHCTSCFINHWREPGMIGIHQCLLWMTRYSIFRWPSSSFCWSPSLPDRLYMGIWILGHGTRISALTKL